MNNILGGDGFTQDHELVKNTVPYKPNGFLAHDVVENIRPTRQQRLSSQARMNSSSRMQEAGAQIMQENVKSSAAKRQASQGGVMDSFSDPQYQSIGQRNPLSTHDINGGKMNRYGVKLEQDPNTVGFVAGSSKMGGGFVPKNKTNSNNSTVFSHYDGMGGQAQALPPKAPSGRPPMPGQKNASIIQDQTMMSQNVYGSRQSERPAKQYSTNPNDVRRRPEAEMNELYFQGGAAPQRAKKSSNASSLQGGIFGEAANQQNSSENVNPTFANMQQKSAIFDENAPVAEEKIGGKQIMAQYQNTSSMGKIVSGDYTHNDGFAKPPVKKAKPTYGYGQRKAM